MITPEEIVGMTDLTEEEVMAIAEHEHTTGVLAAAMVEYLMQRHGHRSPVQFRRDMMDTMPMAA